MIMQTRYFCIYFENFSEDHSKLPPELGETIREMTISLDTKDKM